MTVPELSVTVLIDGSYALHRVLKVGGELNPFANLTSSDGIPTGGCFAYINGLSHSLGNFNVRSVVNVWDSGVYSARRLKIYENYKCSRSQNKMTEEGREYFTTFEGQKQMVQEFLQTLGVPSVTIKNKEADDVIGFLCKIVEGPVIILSDDKDYWHLINDRVCVYRPVKDQFLSLANFAKESKGFQQPWRYLLYCAMIGDDGDDIPGIKSVGGTTAGNVAMAVESPTRTAVTATCRRLAFSDKRNAKRYNTIAQSFNIIGRNYRLLDVRLEEFTAEDQASLLEQMNTYHVPNDLQVMSKLKKYDMQSIAGKINYWIQPFRRLAKPTLKEV